MMQSQLMKPPIAPRGRKPTACYECTSRKRKCDRIKPKCGQCKAQSRQCVYKPQKQSTNGGPSSENKELPGSSPANEPAATNHVNNPQVDFVTHSPMITPGSSSMTLDESSMRILTDKQILREASDAFFTYINPFYNFVGADYDPVKAVSPVDFDLQYLRSTVLAAGASLIANPNGHVLEELCVTHATRIIPRCNQESHDVKVGQAILTWREFGQVEGGNIHANDELEQTPHGTDESPVFN